jgi:trans-aconitate 2-methyltransferase
MKYVWNAEDYAGNSLVQFRWAEEMIEKLELTGDESVLDIGCGDGKVTARIAEAVPNGRVIGIDSSESMVRFASDRFPEDVYPNLSFRCMDATQIDLPEKFDIAFSNASLHWVRDQGS